jgi:hypothetical protein
MMCALGAQMENVDFVETGFRGWMDFIVFWYLVMNSGLPSNNFISKVM